MHPDSASGLWARFSARFDDVLLQPPMADLTALPAVDCVDAEGLRRALSALCQAGPPFASAHHTLAATAGQRAQQQAWLQHQLLALDGTLHMRQLGGAWRQRLHRLGIKLQEALASAATPTGGPWDCGWLNTSAAAQARATQFKPRRPTLVLAWDLPPATWASVHAALQAGGAASAPPLRLWVLNAPVASQPPPSSPL